MDHDVGAGEILRANPECIEGSAKSGQSRPDPGGIVGGWLHPDIEIARRARDAMGCQRVSADDEKPDLMREKGGEEVPKVRVHALSRAPAGPGS